MIHRFELETNATALATWADVHDSRQYQPYLDNLPLHGRLVPVLRMGVLSGEREIAWMREGLIPSYACDERGAEQRVEAHAESMTCDACFRSAFRRRRCIVPATVLHEQRPLRGIERPCSFALESGDIFGIAAVWETWTNDQGHEVESFAMITARVTPLLSTLFERLPVILDGPKEYDRWLHVHKNDDPPLDLLRPLSPGLLRHWKMMPGPVNLHLDLPVAKGEEPVAMR
jgi:putative SOS response-associated peptidase YedK